MRKPGSDPLLLLVNHHHDTNVVMECVLWTHGYDADVAMTLTEGVTRLAAARYDLLIARNAMPDGCGIDLIELAWKQFGVPSLFLTGTLEGQKLAAKANPSALKGVLMMPLAPQQLFSMVEAALGPQHKRPPADVSRTCPDCRGAGQIALLVRRVSCERCSGTGRITPHPLDVPLRQLQMLGVRTRMRLHRAGIKNLREAKNLSDAQLKTVPGLTEAGVAELRKAMDRFEGDKVSAA